MGRSHRAPVRVARVQARCEQHRRRAGAPGGHASRRHPLFPAPLRLPKLHARPARDEPRVHRRRPSAQRRARELECREGSQSAECPRLQRDRGRAPGWTMDGGTPFPLCTPDHCRNTDSRLRPRGGRDGHAHGSRPVGQDSAGNVQQLRRRLHAMGHVSHVRRELRQLFRQPRHDDRRAPENGHLAKGPRLPLGRVRRTLRCRQASERAAPPRLGRRIRPVRSAVDAGQTHGARPLQPRRRSGHARFRRAARRLHG